MIPAKNEDYVGEGLAFLTSQFAPPNAPQLAALLTSYLNQCQELEDALWDVWTMRQLVNLLPPNGVGGTLVDTVGLLVGQSREGLDDADYVAVITLRIAVNRMTGAVPGWSNVMRILLGNGNAGGPGQYFEAIVPPGVSTGPNAVRASAGFRLCVWDMGLNPNVVAQTLARGVPHGVDGQFEYSTWPDGQDLEWSSRYASGTGEQGWGSVYSTGYLLTSSLGKPESLLGRAMVLGVPPSVAVGVGGFIVACADLTTLATAA